MPRMARRRFGWSPAAPSRHNRRVAMTVSAEEECVDSQADFSQMGFDELVARLRSEPSDADVAADPLMSASYYSDVGWALSNLGANGIAWLVDEVPRVEQDEPRLRGVLLGLRRRDVPEAQMAAVRDVFRRCLGDARPLIVMDALDGLGMLEDTMSLGEVLALRDAASEWVRAGVLRYMQDCAPAQAVTMALGALSDPHFIVRETAIDVLDELGAVGQHLDRIRLLLGDEHPDVRAAAHYAIEAAEEDDKVDDEN